MKRAFADLHLRLNMKDSAATLLVMKVAELGYGLIAVPLAPETPMDKVAKLRAICSEAKIDFALRIDLRPRTRNDLMHQLRS